MKRLDLIMLLAVALLMTLISGVAVAQTEDPTPTPDPSAESPIPQVHIVASGENLTLIADQYGVTVEDIMLINQLTSSSVLFPGQELIIPGGTGDEVPTLHEVALGESLSYIAQLYNTTSAEILADNRLINPAYAPAVGQSLPLISRTGSAESRPITGTATIAHDGETLLEVAVRENVNPYAIRIANNLTNGLPVQPGQRLRLPGDEAYAPLPDGWQTIEVGPLPIVQGNTVSIRVDAGTETRPSGEFAGQPLRFTPHPDGGYVALVGIDAFTEPGGYPLTLQSDESYFWQPITVDSAEYLTQSIELGPEYDDLLNPSVRSEEDEFLATYYARFSDTPRWEGLFQKPVTTTLITAGYGGARSYNGGPIDIYHSGVDFAGNIGTPILAPAPGEVIFTDALALRGQTVIIDHGLGVMTGYYHLSEIFVAVGDQVEPGQPIGAGGSTGLSTGPHLHWDLRIMNVPVDGLKWTETAFP